MITVDQKQGVDREWLNYARANWDSQLQTIFLVDLHDPAAYVRDLPSEFQPPSTPAMAVAKTGLPPNVWVGMTAEIDRIRRSGFFGTSRIRDLDRAEDLLRVRARVLWLRLVGPAERIALERVRPILGAWRCSSCGQRGDYPRPLSGYCPHKLLCGDARLEPQIQLLFLEEIDEDMPVITDARRAGTAIFPELPNVGRAGPT